jgi:hypothetical protein
MSETTHLTFNRLVYVDGKLAAECVKEDVPYFEAAYRTIFPTSTITVLSPLQAVRARHKAEEEAELVANEQGSGEQT